MNNAKKYKTNTIVKYNIYNSKGDFVLFVSKRKNCKNAQSRPLSERDISLGKVMKMCKFSSLKWYAET